MVSGRSSGKYSVTQAGLVGGEFLVAVNGEDQGLIYDGSDWLPWGTGTYAIKDKNDNPVDTSKFSYVWKYANRIFALEKDSKTIWFLPVDVVAGEMKIFSLAGVLQEGGHLIIGDVWSLDSGAGLDDKCVFISSTGEVAVYRGTDPSNVNAWAIEGVYDIGTPLGARATMRAGGELVVATDGGLVPISEAIRKDPAALSLNSISRAIEPVWVEETLKRGQGDWELLKWDQENKAIVMLPTGKPNWAPRLFVVNTETGGWCEYDGWDCRCMGIFKRYAFYGDSAGQIVQMEAGGSDLGQPYTMTIVWQYKDFGSSIKEKTCHMLQTICRSNVKPKLKAGVAIDFSIKPQTPPASIPSYTSSSWGSAVWGVSKWGNSSVVENIYKRNHSIERSGFAFAPVVQATYQISPRPKMKLLSATMSYN